jgi:hypothetical protein
MHYMIDQMFNHVKFNQSFDLIMIDYINELGSIRCSIMSSSIDHIMISWTNALRYYKILRVQLIGLIH